MKDIQEKVSELGLTLPQCPAPLAAYIPATRYGDTIVVSGQLPSINIMRTFLSMPSSISPALIMPSVYWLISV